MWKVKEGGWLREKVDSSLLRDTVTQRLVAAVVRSCVFFAHTRKQRFIEIAQYSRDQTTDDAAIEMIPPLTLATRFAACEMNHRIIADL